MKSVLLGSVALLAIAGHAQAYSVDQFQSNAPLPATSAPTATSSTAPYEPNQTTSVPGLRRSPFEGTVYAGRAFDSVEANGSATFAATSFGQSNGALGTFAFVFGSPDTYNGLEFTLGGSSVLTLSGSQIGSTPQSGYFLTRISGIGSYDSVTFTSAGSNAFEFAALSAVPLPASLPMFGGALLALAGFGYGVNRWVAPKGKTASAAA